ncbi:hypothetical protein JCM11251_002780 [Rhodosporidiobolus azoricus]
MLVSLTLIWLFLQLFRNRLNTVFARLSSPFTVHLSPFSLHLATTSPSLLRIPDALVGYLPRLERHRSNGTGDGKRRLGIYWDLGALASLFGGVVAQVVLLVAAGKAVRALWTFAAGSAAISSAAMAVAKRAPVDTALLPPSAGSPGDVVKATDDLLLRPLIPSLSSLPLLVLAIAVSQVWHELGHAMAAVSESIPLRSFGLHLIFLVLPTPYVGVSSTAPVASSLPLTASDASSVAPLSPQTDLRIASAGVWHNLLMLGGAWLLAQEGGSWGIALLESLRAVERRDEGVVVVEVASHSALASHLTPNTLITHLDDLELDASSAPGGSTAKAWEDFLMLTAGPGQEDPYTSMGWCLDEGLFNEVNNEGEEACCSAEQRAEEGPRFCFDDAPLHSSSNSVVFQACLNPLPFLPPFPSTSSQPPARCIDSSSCVSLHPGTICARMAEEEQVHRIGTIAAGQRGRGEKRTVLWQGGREGVWRQVVVTDLEPQYWFIPLGFEQNLERFLGCFSPAHSSILDPPY